MLPTEVQGYFLLTRAGLTKEQEREVLASCGGKLDRPSIERGLRTLRWDSRGIRGAETGKGGKGLLVSCQRIPAVTGKRCQKRFSNGHRVQRTRLDTW